jgi:hypothetical protein
MNLENYRGEYMSVFKTIFSLTLSVIYFSASVFAQDKTASEVELIYKSVISPSEKQGAGATGGGGIAELIEYIRKNVNTAAITTEDPVSLESRLKEDMQKKVDGALNLLEQKMTNDALQLENGKILTKGHIAIARNLTHDLYRETNGKSFEIDFSLVDPASGLSRVASNSMSGKFIVNPHEYFPVFDVLFGSSAEVVRAAFWVHEIFSQAELGLESTSDFPVSMKFLSLHASPVTTDNKAIDLEDTLQTKTMAQENTNSLRTAIGAFCSTLETKTLGDAYHIALNTGLRAIRLSSKITDGEIQGDVIESKALARDLLEVAQDIRRVMGSDYSGHTIENYGAPANRFKVIRELCQLGTEFKEKGGSVDEWDRSNPYSFSLYVSILTTKYLDPQISFANARQQMLRELANTQGTYGQQKSLRLFGDRIHNELMSRWCELRPNTKPHQFTDYVMEHPQNTLEEASIAMSDIYICH